VYCLLCLFSFQHRCDEAFSTEPVKNCAKSVSFQHVQQVLLSLTATLLLLLVYNCVSVDRHGFILQRECSPESHKMVVVVVVVVLVFSGIVRVWR